MIDKLGELEITIKGAKGNFPLSVRNYDIKEIQSVIESIEDILYPVNKKQRPIISYNIEDGSVRHIFKTQIQAIIAFTAIMLKIKEENSIDFLEENTARAIQNFQELSRKNNYDFEFSTSEARDKKLVISPNTSFIKKEETWVDAEFYFYGTITDAGGKNKANIHIDTEQGVMVVSTPKEILKNIEENLLYKELAIRVKGKQSINTGELDRSSFKFIELIDYNANFNDSYLNSLIEKAQKSWNDVDADVFMKDFRGEYV